MKKRKQIIGKPAEKPEYCCKFCELELTDEEIEEIKLIDMFTQRVIDADVCEENIYDILLELFRIGRNIGFNDCKDSLVEVLLDEE